MPPRSHQTACDRSGVDSPPDWPRVFCSNLLELAKWLEGRGTQHAQGGDVCPLPAIAGYPPAPTARSEASVAGGSLEPSALGEAPGDAGGAGAIDRAESVPAQRSAGGVA
jgi:hypothetical protein